MGGNFIGCSRIIEKTSGKAEASSANDKLTWQNAKKTLAFWHINVNVAMPFGWLSWRWTGLACAPSSRFDRWHWVESRQEVSSHLRKRTTNQTLDVWFGVDFFLSQALIFRFYVRLQECTHVCLVSLGFEFGGFVLGQLSNGDGDEKSPFLRFDGDHPHTTNCKPMKIIANIWQVTSLIQPSTGIFCVQPADGYRHQFNRQSLWFLWLWWGPFFQLQHVSTLSIMLVNFNHLQYWQNKKRLWNHLGERGYSQPMSIHHFWRDFALYWHWHRFLSVKIPNFRNNKTFSMATSLPHKKMGELPSSKLTWQ